MKKLTIYPCSFGCVMLIFLLSCGQGDDRSAADLTMPVVVEKIKPVSSS